MIIVKESNKLFANNISELSFDELKKLFWSNHDRALKLKKGNIEREQLIHENDLILDRIHVLNWG